MTKLKNLLTKIIQITNNIETNYPELYRTLDENPMTIPAINRPKIDTQVLEEYLQSLKQLMKHHLETHNSKNN